MVETSSPVLIGQLTDTHVVADADTDEHYVDNNARLAAAIASIAVEAPGLDAVLMTGDLTDTSHPDAFATLTELLGSIDVPVLALPGNHDTREATRRALPDAGWIDAEHLSWVNEIRGVRLIGLDSTRPGYHGAEFDDERAVFLDATLAEPHGGTTLLAMHHPPFATGIDWMDEAGFVGLDRFTEVLAAHPGAVDKIVCGHLHRSITAVVAGVPAQVGISTVQHVALDLAPDSEPSLVLDPVGYQIHRIVGGRGVERVVTHTRYIETRAASFVPDWAGDYDPTQPS
ncbi:MAG: phosphodiesterase [Ilumatobacter sp.]|uniref:phosphodiesterase n=1 Tax=Ilumatobacter sp. TaxID=1967498 RepID=UPI003C73722C